VTASVHYSSATDDWGTPREFFDGLHHEFQFTLDVCASIDTAKVPRFYSVAEDGLVQPWAPETCWMNPPYGRAIAVWCAKAVQEAAIGATVVGLLPARTDTDWWHRYVIPASEIRFIRGRLRFYGMGKDAPFPSAVVVWRPA
jgi:phage N-6-adenine-methyltransferase